MESRTGKVLLVVGMFFVVLGLLSYLFPPKNAYGVPHYDVPGLMGLAATHHRESGDRMEGYFTIRHGDEEIHFSV